jgi:hypothetical protein
MRAVLVVVAAAAALTAQPAPDDSLDQRLAQVLQQAVFTGKVGLFFRSGCFICRPLWMA